MEPLLLWLLFGIGAYFIAKNKGKNPIKWFILGILFGPFGLLFCWISGGRQCPFCKSQIHQEASICPHCCQTIPLEQKQSYLTHLQHPRSKETYKRCPECRRLHRVSEIRCSCGYEFPLIPKEE